MKKKNKVIQNFTNSTYISIEMSVPLIKIDRLELTAIFRATNNNWNTDKTVLFFIGNNENMFLSCQGLIFKKSEYTSPGASTIDYAKTIVIEDVEMKLLDGNFYIDFSLDDSDSVANWCYMTLIYSD